MAKSPVIELLISNISGALTRVRAIIFVNLALCAVILSNAYLENFSFDRRQIQNSYVRQEQYEKEKRELEAKLKDTNLEIEKRRPIEYELSQKKAAIQFIENSRKDHKLNSILVPVIGVSIPGNDVNIVCGIFLLFTSVWIVFSANQIKSAFDDDAVSSDISDYMVALRHAVVFIIPESNSMLRVLGTAVISAPAITMTLAWFNDIVSSVNNLNALGQLGMWDVVLIRIIFLTVITVCLWSIAAYSYFVWKKLGSKFFPE